ncbi:hypothetical protein CONLIGDRAFT_686854 [Coniochaeta ligniaria NRRL 30616]|uniref:Uncharacterized protein n=1 Tax=Coniochaeta ligniaria NRRL 30616 TaxID=1408157 RepID=A0A1J7J1P8_9PEZI|nr:hypothetical protein CONLIGDRAFT_686854 [Coniochaeta ligniaria NRRL 30616]
MVSDGKTLVFTGVIAFQERLYSFTSDANQEAESQVLSLVDILLSGSALIWWNSELTAQDRRELRNGRRGLPRVLDALRQRFRQGSAMAKAKFTQSRLHLSDLADEDGNPDLKQLSTFDQKKLRYARQTGRLDDDNPKYSLSSIYPTLLQQAFRCLRSFQSTTFGVVPMIATDSHVRYSGRVAGKTKVE